MRLHRLDVDLGDGVRAAFTGRADDEHVSSGPALVGNVATSQPHRPADLAAARAAVAQAVGADTGDLVWMRQVHGARVLVVDEATPPNALMAAGDAMLTDRSDCGLVVQVADCVPVLVAGKARDGARVIGVAHAGRQGVMDDVVGALVEAMRARGVSDLRAAIGPAIRGCCYEVEAWLRDEVVAEHPTAGATTSWGTASVDLARAVADRLAALGVTVQDVGVCTACDDRWFSHRVAARSAGRQAGVVALGRPRPPQADVQ